MRVPLLGGAYQTPGLLAGAQRCLNLYVERMPQSQGEPSPAAHYLTPGLRLLSTCPQSGFRGLYLTTTGQVYAAVGDSIWLINLDYSFIRIITIGAGPRPVSFADNGVDLAIVDGTANGWFIRLSDGYATPIADTAFYGADRVDMIDGFFIFNRPGTAQFYLSNNVARTFNPLYIAAKAGSDKVVSVAVTRREAWIFGDRTTEIYNDVGAADFPLAAVSGGIEHGCEAVHSVVKADGALFWLSKSRDGTAVAMKGAQYQAQRISTHALEKVWQSYPYIKDAVGYPYQQGGNIFYALRFPSADACWVFNLATGEWHEWRTGSTRHISACHCFALGLNLVGDQFSGNLYALDPGTFTDNGTPIQRVRSFPHMVSDGKRVRYTSLIADMQVGSATTAQDEPFVTLRYSDDRGATWSGTQTETLGVAGKTLTSVQFQRLGMARDRVFELSWTAPVLTSLQGAWIQEKVSGS